MKINYIWPNEKENHRYWVECTVEEIENIIFPRLTDEDIERSKKVANYYKDDETLIFLGLDPNYKWCFLISKNLKEITPYSPYYPFHHAWNAYSPFVQCEPREIEKLEEL